MLRRPALVTALLVPLVLLGGWLAPRLHAPTPDDEYAVDDACFRWRQFECCLVEGR